jgi:hypothetical protein
LEVSYSSQDYIDVDNIDNTTVSQTALSEYAIHQFKDWVGDSATCNLSGRVKTNTLPSSSTVVLQVYNQTTNEWVTVDSDDSSGADTFFDFSVTALDLTNYKDPSNVISSRIYQLGI